MNHQPTTFPAQPAAFPAPQPAADQRLPLGDSVDDATIGRHRRMAAVTLILALVAVVGAVLAFKFLPGARPNDSYRQRKWTPQKVGVGVCVLVAVHAIAKAVASRRVAAILQGARWHRSVYSAVSETRGDMKIHHLTLAETGVTYRPISRLLAKAANYGPFVEWTGDADGQIVIRSPHAAKVQVYRPVTAKEAERKTARWK